MVGVDHVTTHGVDDALGLACRAARVQEEEHVFRIELLGFAVNGLVLDQTVVPVVAPFLDAAWERITFAPLDYDYFRNAVHPVDCLIDNVFEV